MVATDFLTLIVQVSEGNTHGFYNNELINIKKRTFKGWTIMSQKPKNNKCAALQGHK